MDDDVTTMAKVKTAVSHPVTKWSNLNHTKKHTSGMVYVAFKNKFLTTKIIQWFKTFCGYVGIEWCKPASTKNSSAYGMAYLPPSTSFHYTVDWRERFR